MFMVIYIYIRTCKGAVLEVAGNAKNVLKYDKGIGSSHKFHSMQQASGTTSMCSNGNTFGGTLNTQACSCGR
jgi:hypothetical protein